jgi:hypothetical protein
MVKALENLKKCEEDTGQNSVLQVRNKWCQSFANSYGKKALSTHVDYSRCTLSHLVLHATTAM